MSRRTLISLALVAVQTAAMGQKLYACGGAYTPNCWLGRDEQLLRSPEGNFVAELRPALPALEAQFVAQPPTRGRGTGQITLEAGAAELQAAMEATGIPQSRRDELLAGYVRLRKHLYSYQHRMTSYRERLTWMSEEGREQAEAPAFEVPEMVSGLPEEFDLYLRGAIAWHSGDVEAARQHWLSVLACRLSNADTAPCGRPT
ncbi:MAG: hypothetical protein ACYTFO_06170 [Planctomycetota bacterium]|jgi:hypothetical protein